MFLRKVLRIFRGTFLCDNEPDMRHHARMKCHVSGDCRTPKGESIEVEYSVFTE